MDYQKHYEQLIAKHGSQDKPEGYSERHHIVPKSMGGSNDDDNLVYLSAKAHFVAHHLLWRWHRNSSMAYAFHRMCHGQQKVYYKPSADAYQEARRARSSAMSTAMSGRGNANYGKVGCETSMFGRKHTEETKAKMSKAQSGKKGHWAKVANIYDYKTGDLLACGVVLKGWAVDNGYNQGNLAATARGLYKQSKGIYARYI